MIVGFISLHLEAYIILLFSLYKIVNEMRKLRKNLPIFMTRLQWSLIYDYEYEQIGVLFFGMSNTH